MSLSEDEARIDARLKETERSIAELQKQRQELLQAKKALAGGKARDESPRPPQPEATDKALEKTLNMLEWKAFKKKDGEWAFLRDMNGRLVEDLQGVTEFVDQLRKGRQIVVGRYRYSASDDKFLNRFFADAD
ncbi:MAG: hypothetical protein OK441_05765 [Thaumarchaeota archaeon]|nr:hypothetical protein [Nitrososphaerota archaeon]